MQIVIFLKDFYQSNTLFKELFFTLCITIPPDFD